MTIEISAKLLKEHGLPYVGWDGVEVVANEIVNTSRWSIHHRLIFKWIDGKFYETSYSVGATENQDERAWEYEKEVSCVEVAQVEKVVKVWEPVS